MTDAVATSLIVTAGGLISALMGLVFKRLGVVAANVNGAADALRTEISALKTEIVRLQQPGTSTGYGTPTPERPVMLSAGEPVVLHSEKKKP